MVTRKEVCDAADRIRARDASPGGVKERVSVRSVRKEVGRGSFGDIARELGHWRKDANYHPVIERADLPEALQSRLTTLGKELLEQARIEATRERLADFADVERRREECDRIVAEAADRVDALEERVTRLQSELDRSGGVRASVTGMPAAPGLADPRSDRGRKWVCSSTRCTASSWLRRRRTTGTGCGRRSRPRWSDAGPWRSIHCSRRSRLP
ncbi:hypothetical protein GCM10025880_30870 [Methylorubrum aminovorans]|nr:hypothetical protein GCM10025880_30870 [Methylorubrum aminovorans]